jgi:hypothetical protein
MSTTAIILVIAVPAIATVTLLYILALPLQFIVVALGIYWMICGLYAASRLFW